MPNSRTAEKPKGGISQGIPAETDDSDPPQHDTSDYPRQRRHPTPLEARALAHTLRQKIVRMCRQDELTNKQLADRLGSEPGTILPHVRMLVEAEFLEVAAVRTGPSGALEKPYRSTGKTWWLDDPLAGTAPDVRFGPVEMAMAEARQAGPDALATYATFMLHLSQDDVAEIDRRILAVLDQYIESDQMRLDQPAHLGLVVLHRVVPTTAEQSKSGVDREPK